MLIFLDVDGVLNTKSEWKTMYSLNNECVKNFAEFCKKINGVIILTSTWRHGFESPNSSENAPYIKRLESTLKQYGIFITDKTPFLKNRKRDDEIQRYLYFHPTNQYIIIDDDRNEFSNITKHNYFIDATTGFTKRDIRGCMKCI